MIDQATSEPMKYWQMSKNESIDSRRLQLEHMIRTKQYIQSEKIDGNQSRAVLTPSQKILQTRGISKTTGTYGEVQDKVFFWPNIVKAFTKGETVLLGEIYLEHGIDRDVGSILRCLPDKAMTRQKTKQLKWYIFDVLVLDGQDYSNTNVEARTSLIDAVVQRINSPLVCGAKYHAMNEHFFDDLSDILARGGEGVICYHKKAVYEPGKRGPHAWDSCKVKREITNDIDCFITGIEPPTKDYTGRDLYNWPYWRNTRTGQRLNGQYFSQFQEGRSVEPITKNYYYNQPSAIDVAVIHNGKIIPLCKVAGLDEKFKTALRDNFDKYYQCPLTIGGMMVSDAQAAESGIGISIRHPFIKALRYGDISVQDCTLDKILS